MENPKAHGAINEFNLPEWETTARYRGEGQPAPSTGRTLKRKTIEHFDRLVPPHRKYFGVGRKVACIICIIILAAIVVVIIGLAAGISNHRRSVNHKKLPSGSKSYTGDLTYYSPGLGACGVKSKDKDKIVSISHILFDRLSKGSNPNKNPLCGHRLRATYKGQSVDLKVVDRCVGCSATDIDVSPSAFKKLADPKLGRVKVTWAWLPPVPAT